MVSLTTRVDKQGFWYLIEGIDDCDFSVAYIVIGTGGRQGSGEIHGSASHSTGWQHVAIGFPTLHVGITDLRISPRVPDGALEQASQRQIATLPRRKAIRTLAASLFGGGALMMFPQSFSQARVNIDSYNPYKAEGADSHFKPY